jgi:predicted esterase
MEYMMLTQVVTRFDFSHERYIMNNQIIRIIAIITALFLLTNCAKNTLISTHSSHIDYDELLSFDNSVYLRQGHAAWGDGNYEKAIEYFLKFWQTQRDNPDALFSIAAAYARLNNPEMAGRFLLEASKRTLSMDPNRINRIFEEVLDREEFLHYRDEMDKTIRERERNRGYISYIESPTKLRYRTVLPDDFDPEKEYTVLIFMHGFGGSPFNFHRYADILIERNIIFVQPQAPYPFEMSISGRLDAGFSWVIFDYNEGEFNAEHSAFLTNNHIVNLSKSLREKYNISSMFLSGFSQGGMQTLGIGLSNQDAFDGLICFGGGLLLPIGSIKENGDIPVLIVHGNADLVVTLEMGTTAYERLKNKGYNVTINLFDGAHVIPREEFIKALDWLEETKSTNR